ncbi:reverse transcriptase [Gossypium australe]|uniref:Reverse transcriptase n=1 Tax=Gossypium australe TaxID=47621 RepID=A0A5B6VAY6_9ROSI|nr:reverse transcriptase [Gossypium australe]
MARFWWQKGHGRRRIHWCAWSYMCRLKEKGQMGFRSMGKFNITLLVKQCLRLINYPDSLLARVLKVKYFPRSDFINAPLSNLSSYTWKSIWAAKGVLQEGLCWRVGSGVRVSINEDAWILGADNFRLGNYVHGMKNSMVANLIDAKSRRIAPFHHHSFFRRVRFSVSLNFTKAHNKSTLLKGRTFTKSPGTIDIHLEFFESRWHKRHMMICLYGVCGEDVETLNHVFCVCLISTEVCVLSAIRFGLSRETKILGYIENYLIEVKEIEKWTLPRETMVVKWGRPSGSSIKINFDGAYDDRNFRSALGAVTRNAEGQVMFSWSKIHNGVLSAFVPEAIVCH